MKMVMLSLAIAGTMASCTDTKKATGTQATKESAPAAKTLEGT